ncbi:hypothetical protein M422DRAFT_270753 [Sphaerobolus stellatus SS14]|uniref:Uncharacterized protein n=1 Tax=Sphaerobolus stellatus (strain SS14) TaxID=990650 RepID=A0A0C9URL5_SPHS4|nr:hypothetical protein M422DRAFT_270753 [Sphaerobolus stellatus SS14]
MKVQGVRLQLNGMLIVNALTDEDAGMILRHLEAWINMLAPGLLVSTRTYTVVANFVPVEFDLKEESVRRKVVAENRAVMEREEEVVGLRWLNGKGQGQHSAKRHSSAVITVNSAKLADLLIERNITVLRAICNVQKYIPPPQSNVTAARLSAISLPCAQESPTPQALDVLDAWVNTPPTSANAQ